MFYKDTTSSFCVVTLCSCAAWVFFTFCVFLSINNSVMRSTLLLQFFSTVKYSNVLTESVRCLSLFRIRPSATSSALATCNPLTQITVHQANKRCARTTLCFSHKKRQYCLFQLCASFALFMQRSAMQMSETAQNSKGSLCPMHRKQTHVYPNLHLEQHNDVQKEQKTKVVSVTLRWLRVFVSYFKSSLLCVVLL